MKLTVTIESFGAAFDDGNGGRNEAARILRALADDLAHPKSRDTIRLYDLNGNRVGSAHFEPEDTDNEG